MLGKDGKNLINLRFLLMCSLGYFDYFGYKMGHPKSMHQNRKKNQLVHYRGIYNFSSTYVSAKNVN